MSKMRKTEARSARSHLHDNSLAFQSPHSPRDDDGFQAVLDGRQRAVQRLRLPLLAQVVDFLQTALSFEGAQLLLTVSLSLERSPLGEGEELSSTMSSAQRQCE